MCVCVWLGEMYCMYIESKLKTTENRDVSNVEIAYDGKKKRH